MTVSSLNVLQVARKFMHCCHSTLDEIQVSLMEQTLSYLGRTYSISSSRYGIGTEEGSNKTPLGTFQISEKFGAGDEMFSVYVGRQKKSVWNPEDQDLTQDMILSRILRLSGLDEENTNTYQRYIYIHGTNDEDGIGSEKSMGCLRMSNPDVISLYNLAPLGTVVHINEQ